MSSGSSDKLSSARSAGKFSKVPLTFSLLIKGFLCNYNNYYISIFSICNLDTDDIYISVL